MQSPVVNGNALCEKTAAHPVVKHLIFVVFKGVRVRFANLDKITSRAQQPANMLPSSFNKLPLA